jgi:hypothetical protein
MSKPKGSLKLFTTEQPLELLREEAQRCSGVTGNKLSHEERVVAKLQLEAARLVVEDVLQDCLEVGKIDAEFCKEKMQMYACIWESNIRSFAVEIMERAAWTFHGNRTIH